MRTVLLAMVLLAPALRPQVTVEELTDLMEFALGVERSGPTAAPAGDWVLKGVLTSEGQSFLQTVSVRCEPFGYREELQWLPGAPGAVPPPGVPSNAVFLSDGELSWNLADELGPEAPLPGWAAVAALDNALLFRLLLDPRSALGGANGTPRVMTEEVKPHEPGVEALHVTWPQGTGWLAAVERDSGRLTGLYDSTRVTNRWFTLSEWREFEGGLSLPAVLRAGKDDATASVVRYHSVQRGPSAAPGTYPEPPTSALEAVVDAARLELAHGPLPGAMAVIVPDVELRGEHGRAREIWTLLDTGASGLYAEARLAGPLKLPLIGRQTDRGLFGGGESDSLWVDSLHLGSHPVLQLSANTPPLPAGLALPREHPLGLVFGGRRLMALSPVLDLRGRRLLLRGTVDGRVRPLSEIVGRAAVTLPLLPDERGSLHVAYTLGGGTATALLDTGYPYVARLSRADVRRLGLPLDEAEWLRRGALGIVVTGVHGHERVELLVRLDQDLHLGPVTLQRPMVILMGESLEGAELAADVTLIGMGALSAFEQVGFDRGLTLELVAPAALVRAAGPERVIVPPTEDQLGFDLQPADLGATGRPHSLPHVVRVLPGLPADRAGLRDGDFLAAVDGVACDDEAPMESWNRLRLRGRPALGIQVMREGELVDVVIQGSPPPAVEPR